MQFDGELEVEAPPKNVPLEVPFTPAAVIAQNLSVQIKAKKNATKTALLRPTSIYIEPGDFVAVVGPSGAGKTTLLNALAGRGNRANTTGLVRLIPTDSESQRQRPVRMSYVVVDGKLLPYLTVLETLNFAAALKLPHHSKSDRAERVAAVMKLLKLDYCKDTYVGGEWKKGLSTGERKRVNIAIELLGGASVLILDEPTSGLDSSLAGELLSLLRDISTSGRAVICTVHQPTSVMWAWFDKLILIGSGSVVYQGPAGDAKDYFRRLGFECPKTFNPSDFFLSLISVEEDDEVSLQRRSGSTSTNSRFGSRSDSTFEAVTVSNVSALQAATSATLRKLVHAYEGSAEAHSIQKRVGTLLTMNEVVLTPADASVKPLDSVVLSYTEGNMQPKETTYLSSFTAWWAGVFALFIRAFKNSIRSPIVCCVLLLVQALQGVILGGIFWQVKSPIKSQEMFTLDDVALLENDWSQLLVSGIEGRQPLLEALENGVDGAGSQPLLQLLDDADKLLWLQKIAHCAPQHANLTSLGYPNLGVQPIFLSNAERQDLQASVDRLETHSRRFRAQQATSAISYKSSGKLNQDVHSMSSRAWDGTVPAVLDPYYALPGIVGLMQMADNAVMRHDWPPVKECLKRWEAAKDYTNYWYMLSSTISRIALNPIAFCARYPEYKADWWADPVCTAPTIDGPEADVSAAGPGGSPVVNLQFQQFQKTQQAYSEALKRKLITVEGDFGMGQAMTELLGAGAADTAATARALLNRMRGCNHRVCSWLDEKISTLTDLGNDGYDALMVLVNVLGALYFLTANLGFSSYDALLTFPQERILFNRESAAGMYSASQYFLAKNFADFPFQVVPALLFGAIFYVLVGLEASQFAMYSLIIVCMTFAAYGFGYFVAAAAPRMEIAVVAAPVVLVIWLTTAGFFLREDQIPVWINWFSYISFYKWGFFSLVNNQFPEGDHLGVLSNVIPTIASGVSETRVAVTTLYIFVCGMLYRVCAFIALKYAHRRIGLQ